MVKRAILAIVVVFLAWAALDFVIHGVLLRSIYEASATLWRPMDELNIPLVYAVMLAYAICFVAIYGLLVANKSLAKGVQFGVLFGLGAGISMGFGTYAFMPIPLTLAWGWLVGTLVEAIVAGALVGLILKPGKRTA